MPTTYTVTGWRTHTQYHSVTVDAETPQEAIDVGRKDLENADWNDCDDPDPIDFVEAYDEDEENTAYWTGPDHLAHRGTAASAMLAALKECTDFLSGHRETPAKVARYQRHLAAIAAAEAAGIKAEG